MHRNCLKIASLVIISGCASWTKPDVKSDWSALSEADGMDCRELPLLPEDLRIDRVHILPSTGPTLLLEISSRKGVKNFYHLAFRKESDLKAGNLVKLPVSQDAVFLGGGVAGQKTVFVVHTKIKDNPFIQVRDLASNVVVAQFPSKIKGAFDLGPWQIEGDKLYTMVREEKNEEANDDQVYQELEIPFAPGQQVRYLTTQVVGNQVKTFGDNQGKRWVMNLDRGVSSKVKEPRFRMRPWMTGKKDAGAIELDEKGPIESWDFHENDGALTLAFVKGDSLLWENTALVALSLPKAEPFQKMAEANLALTRVHAAQPLVSSNNKDTFVFLPQWLDHEISVGRYRVNGSELAPQGFLGIFKEGTTFEDSFYHDPSEKFYLLSRFNGGPTPKYSLCEVD